MTILTNAQKKKAFFKKHYSNSFERLEEKLAFHQEKIIWINELIEEKKNTKRRQS